VLERHTRRARVVALLAVLAVLLGVLLGVALPSFRQPPPAARRPHILLVVADSLRARNLGCYGYRGSPTPTIDRLAAEGVVFEQAIAVGGNTSSSMSALFTGRYPFFEFGEPWTEAPYGMERFRRQPGMGLPTDMTTVAESLMLAGYRTVAFVTNPYVGPTFAMQQGFRLFEEIRPADGAEYATAEAVSRRAVRFVRTVDTDRPSFLYLHFMDTHGPYLDPQAPADEAGRAGRDEAWRGWSTLGGTEASRHAAPAAAMTAAYDSGVRRVDAALDRILKAYAKRGLLEDTLVVFTADHGEEFLEHGGTTHKGTLFEELVHVPLVVRAPGGAAGRRWPGLVRSFDVAPTLLDYAGIPSPGADMDALSLRPAVEGRAFQGPTFAYAGFPGLRMVRGERYKLLRRADGSEMLFDLRRDPAETVNLAGSAEPGPRAARAALATALDTTVDRLRRQGVAGTGPATVVLDEPTRRRLRALGYVE
jgi:arylsulfatase A-like enzyme